MQVVKNYPDGVFCWVDLTTPDPEAAKAFYTGLFGWEADDQPIDMGGIYTMLQLEGKNVAGLMPHPERALFDWMGGEDGRLFFESLL